MYNEQFNLYCDLIDKLLNYCAEILKDNPTVKEIEFVEGLQKIVRDYLKS